jgi:hypothetical protein
MKGIRRDDLLTGGCAPSNYGDSILKSWQWGIDMNHIVSGCARAVSGATRLAGVLLAARCTTPPVAAQASAITAIIICSPPT